MVLSSCADANNLHDRPLPKRINKQARDDCVGEFQIDELQLRSKIPGHI